MSAPIYSRMDKSRNVAPKMPVRVETYFALNADGEINSHDQEPESMKRIDYANSSDRKWLANHCMWALNNGRAVLTSPESN